MSWCVLKEWYWLSGQTIPWSTNHEPPKLTCLEVCMVNNLVFRWPKPLFFMVLGGSWNVYQEHNLGRLVDVLQREHWFSKNKKQQLKYSIRTKTNPVPNLWRISHLLPHEASLLLATSSPLIFHKRWRLWSNEKKKKHTGLTFPRVILVGFCYRDPQNSFHGLFVCYNPHRSLGYNPGPFIQKKSSPQKNHGKIQLSLDPATFEVPSYLQLFRGTKRKVTKMLIIARRPLLNSWVVSESIPWVFGNPGKSFTFFRAKKICYKRPIFLRAEKPAFFPWFLGGPK